MREIEFLPDWFRTLRARWRAVVVQSWLTVALGILLVGWTVNEQRQVRASAAELTSIRDKMETTERDLRKLDDLLELERQWRQKALIRDRLGQHVDASRLLRELESLMPSAMGLIDLQVTTEEVPRPVPAGLVAAAPAKGEPPTDRRMKVRLQGVAPTDVDLANFLAALSGVDVFEQIAMNYARPRSQDGHVMREFEVQFQIALEGGTAQ